MKIIKDIKGREWKLQITVGTIKRVRGELDMDLYNIGDDGFITTIIDDPVKLVELLWLMFEDQAKEEGISAEDFLYGFAGDEIAIATNLFLEELTDFFPPSKRKPARDLLAKIQRLAEKAYKKVEVMVEEIDEDAVIDTVMETMKQK